MFLEHPTARSTVLFDFAAGKVPSSKTCLTGPLAQSVCFSLIEGGITEWHDRGTTAMQQLGKVMTLKPSGS